MKRIIYFSFLLLSYIGYGQSEYSLSGAVLDQNNTPVEAGDVILYDKNSNLVKYTFIKNGKFIFDRLKANEYTLSIIAIGYTEKSEVILLDSNKTITIELKENTVILDEVTVKTIKNNIIVGNGNLKINIENSVLESLPSTVDILSKLPGIQISPNRESISVVGRGAPLIYIDNQKADLDQLKSLSVENIKDIELIDNPSAKYEAEGRSLILITRKHNSVDGYKIQLSEIISFKKRFNNYLGIHSNYKNNKLELRGNFNYNQLGPWEGVDSRLNVLDQGIKSQYQVRATGPRPQFITGGGFFYQLDKNDYISGQVNLRAQTDKFPIKTNTLLQDQFKEDHIISEGQNDENRNFLSSNINFNKKITRTSNLFFGLQYSNYIRHLKSHIFNNINETGLELSQNRNQKYEISVFASKIDIDKNFNDHIKLEVGGSLSNANGLAFSDFEFINPIDKKVSKYDYRESIYASYVQLSGNLNKIEYSTGIRSETNIIKGGFRNASELLVDRKQTRLFPKIRINIPIDSTKSIALNYGTIINRPNYLNASSISTFINPFVEFSRNVNLKSTTIEEISTTLQYKKYTCNISYYEENDPVFYNVAYDSIENRVISSPQNFEKESGYQIRFTNTATYRFWNTTNSLTVVHNRIKNPTAVIRESKPYLYYYSNNEFKLASKTTLGLNFWGFTERNQGVFKRNALFIMSASFSKTYFKNLQIAVNFNDIFKNMTYKDKYTSNNIDVQNTFYVDGNEISFSIKYAFGKVKKLSFKNKDVDDNLDRIR
ncbi:outer membrane beta-barrel family protein [Aquimarina macrocephali]|uniref:outer membrane beta-barrel family protein n=1 Tax=Aquimarina macrocephali TaxID=666563 RepID=UPI00046744AB|nr:outer membrane beta-barrel family protein [Aquimarina macrocephali]